MTVTSLLELRLKPGDLEKAYAHLHEILKDTRAFDGCHGVTVMIDDTDPGHVVAVESWESITHDDAYRAWRATPEGDSGLGPLLAGPPVLTRGQNSEL